MTTADAIRQRFPDLSEASLHALQQLVAGKVCIPSPAVVNELGSLGLAYRTNLRSRSRRLSLSTEGAKLIPHNPQQ